MRGRVFTESVTQAILAEQFKNAFRAHPAGVAVVVAALVDVGSDLGRRLGSRSSSRTSMPSFSSPAKNMLCWLCLGFSYSHVRMFSAR